MTATSLPPTTSDQRASAQRTSGKAIASLVGGLLSFCFSFLAAIPALVLGWQALAEIRRSEGRLRGRGLAVSGIVLSLLGMIASLALGILLGIPAVQVARVTASSGQLKQIGLAMHNYHDRHNAFPFAGSTDEKLGLGLSWRVRILPYIKQQSLFDQFDFDEPWDSPRNKALIAEMPAIYKAPGVNLESGKTVYLGVLGGPKGYSRKLGEPDRITFFDSTARATTIRNMTDGPSNTIMVLEVDLSEAAIWTKPDDWEYDPDAPRRGIGTLRVGGVTALFVDGNTDFVPSNVSDADLRRLFLLHDNERFNGYLTPVAKRRKK